MAINPTTGILTVRDGSNLVSPSGNGDLQVILGRRSCFSKLQLICDVNESRTYLEKINIWSKFKPVRDANVFVLKDTIATTLASGLQPVMANTRAALISAVQAALGSNEYKFHGETTLVKYLRPDPANGYPARPYDFDGYDPNATLDTSFPTTPIDGVGPTWGEGYIDLTDTTLTNKTLSNDTNLKTYYTNNMVATRASRQQLHLFDILYNNNALLPTRGVIFFTHNSNTYSYEGTVPFSTDANLVNDLASPSGLTSTVVEFYCNPGNSYVAVPTWAYEVVGYARWSFAGTFIDLDASDWININFEYDTNFTIFGRLELALQESSDSGATWSDLSSATTYILADQHEQVDVRDNYKAYQTRSTDSGHWFRAIVRGSAWNSGNMETYFTTNTIQIP